MSCYEPSTLWALSGPAAGTWYALVLAGETPGPGGLAEVLVVPARTGVDKQDVTHDDVMCPAEASPTGEPLVFAAWAAAPIPAHCLVREIGSLDYEFCRLVEVARLRAAGPSGAAAHLRRPRAGEPDWHQDLRRSLVGYWDGSVMISCATMPPVSLVDPFPARG
jgi:hypothetical protein